MPDVRPVAPPGLEWVVPAIIIAVALILVALAAWWRFKNRRR